MMNNPNLTPEVRVNKNGVPVTKHVRNAPSNTGASSTPLPHPVTPDHEHSKRVHNVISLLDTFGAMPPNRLKKIRNKAEDFSKRTLDVIEEAAKWNAAQPAPDAQFMYTVVLLWEEQTVRESFFCRPLFTRDVGSAELREITDGLHLLERYKSIGNIDEMTGQEMGIVAAYLNVTSALYEHCSDSLEFTETDGRIAMFIKDIDFQSLIDDHHQDYEAIINYVGERGTADAGLIREYLDNGTALAHGVL